MPSSNVIVSGISRLDPPIDRPVGELFNIMSAPPAGTLNVQFNDRQTASLDPAHPHFVPYAEVLDELHRAGLSVYVEVNSDQMITTLRVPVMGGVTALSRDSSGKVTFRLANAAKPFVFGPANPNYRDWVHVLQEAQLDGVPVLVTENELDPEILDIRRAEYPPAPALLTGAALAPALHPAAVGPVTNDRATELFEMVAAKSCYPLRPDAPCIPGTAATPELTRCAGS